MHELAEELLLVHDGVDAALGDNSRLCHFFHRIKSLFLAELDLPHFAETTSTNDVVKVEVVLINLYSQVTKKLENVRTGILCVLVLREEDFMAKRPANRSLKPKVKIKVYNYQRPSFLTSYNQLF